MNDYVWLNVNSC